MSTVATTEPFIPRLVCYRRSGVAEPAASLSGDSGSAEGGNGGPAVGQSDFSCPPRVLGVATSYGQRFEPQHERYARLLTEAFGPLRQRESEEEELPGLLARIGLFPGGTGDLRQRKELRHAVERIHRAHRRSSPHELIPRRAVANNFKTGYHKRDRSGSSSSDSSSGASTASSRDRSVCPEWLATVERQKQVKREWLATVERQKQVQRSGSRQRRPVGSAVVSRWRKSQSTRHQRRPRGKDLASVPSADIAADIAPVSAVATQTEPPAATRPYGGVRRERSTSKRCARPLAVVVPSKVAIIEDGSIENAKEDEGAEENGAAETPAPHCCVSPGASEKLYVEKGVGDSDLAETSVEAKPSPHPSESPVSIGGKISGEDSLGGTEVRESSARSSARVPSHAPVGPSKEVRLASLQFPCDGQTRPCKSTSPQHSASPTTLVAAAAVAVASCKSRPQSTPAARRCSARTPGGASSDFTLKNNQSPRRLRLGVRVKAAAKRGSALPVHEATSRKACEPSSAANAAVEMPGVSTSVAESGKKGNADAMSMASQSVKTPLRHGVPSNYLEVQTAQRRRGCSTQSRSSSVPQPAALSTSSAAVTAAEPVAGIAIVPSVPFGDTLDTFCLDDATLQLERLVEETHFALVRDGLLRAAAAGRSSGGTQISKMAESVFSGFTPRTTSEDVASGAQIQPHSSTLSQSAVAPLPMPSLDAVDRALEELEQGLLEIDSALAHKPT